MASSTARKDSAMDTRLHWSPRMENPPSTSKFLCSILWYTLTKECNDACVVLVPRASQCVDRDPRADARVAALPCTQPSRWLAKAAFGTNVASIAPIAGSRWTRRIWTTGQTATSIVEPATAATLAPKALAMVLAQALSPWPKRGLLSGRNHLQSTGILQLQNSR